MIILSGSLVGMEGRVKKIDRHKQQAKLAICFMGREKLIDIGFETLSPTPDACESRTWLDRGRKSIVEVERTS